MNKIFKVIWNTSTQTFVAVSELANGRGKSSQSGSVDLITEDQNQGKHWFAFSAISVAFIVAGIISQPAFAGTAKEPDDSKVAVDANDPQNPVIVAGKTSSPLHIETNAQIPRFSGTSYDTTKYWPDAVTDNILVGRTAQLWRTGHPNAKDPSKPSPSGTGGSGMIRNIAIGSEATVWGVDSIAMGTNAKTWASVNDQMKNQIAIGTNSLAAGEATIAIGYNAYTSAIGGTAVGNTARAVGQKALAAGFGANTGSSGAIALGENATATFKGALAIGQGAKAVGDDAKQRDIIAIGAKASASKKGSIAFGNSAISTHENSVALGTGAKSSASVDPSFKGVLDNETDESDNIKFAGVANSDTTGGKAKAKVYTVSFGSPAKDATTETDDDGKETAIPAEPGIYRQLKNVAAGELGPDSTDAINGSQLYHVVDKSGFNIEQGGTATSRINNQGKVNFTNGKFTTVTVTDGDNKADIKYDTVTQELKYQDGKVVADGSTAGLVTAQNVADMFSTAIKPWNVTVAADGGALDGAATVEPVNLGDTVTYKAGKGITLKQDGKNIKISAAVPESATLAVASGNDEGKIALPTADDENKLTTAKNVAEMINAAAWKAKAEAAGGEVEGGADEKIAAGDKVIYKAGKGIKLKQEGKNFTISMSESATTTSLNVTSNAAPTSTTGNSKGLLNLNDPTVNNDSVVTVKDIKNLGWVVSADKTTGGNAAYSETVTNAKEVKFVGTGAATVSGKTNGDVRTITVDVAAPETAELKADTANDGKIAAPATADANKLTTAKNVAEMINAAAWKVTSGKTDGENPANTTEKVAAGDLVTYKAGKNIKVEQAGKDFTFSTKDNVEFTSANVTAAAAPTFTSGNTNGLIDLDKASNQNSVVTVKDIKNLGWVVSSDKTTDGNGEYSANVTNAKEVKFIGTGVATVSGKTNGEVRTITVDVKAPETATLTAEPAGDKDGKIAAPTAGDENKLTTAKNVAEMINAAAWKAKVEADGGEAVGGADEKISAGDKVVYKAGKNIKLTQAAKNITVATKDDVTFNSVNVTAAAAPTFAAGTPKTAGLLNLADSTVNDNSVVTVKDIKNLGWVVSSDKTTGGTGEYSANVTNAKEVKFVGTGIATVSGKTDGEVRTITVDVAAPETATLKADKDANDGKIALPETADAGKLTTAKNVAEMINAAAWKVTSGKTDGENPANTTEKVAAGDLVTYKAGKNIKVEQDGKNFTFSTVENPSFTSTTIGDPTKPNEATKLTSDKNGLKLDKTTASPYTKSPDAFDKKANKDEPTAGTGGVNLNNVAWATQPDQAVNFDQLTQTVSSVGFFVQQNTKEVTNPTTAKAEKVTADDVLNFADGKNSKVEVATVRDAATGKDTTTVQVNIESATLTAEPAGDKDGKIAAPATADANKLTTAGNVAEMINAAAWKAKAEEDGGEVEGTATEEKISAGDKVTYKAGKNIKLKQDGKNFTVATKDDVTFNSVNVTAAAAPTFAAGTPKTAGLLNLDAPEAKNDSVVTVKDIKNFGWVVSSDKTTGDLGNAYTDQVRNAKEVKFVGTGIATVSGKTEGDIRTITVNVDAPETATLTAEPAGDKEGKIALPTTPADESKLTTAKNVAEMINAAAWKVTSGKTDGENPANTTEKVAAGDLVTYKAGKNIKVEQDGKNFTFSTVESPSFTSTTIGDPTKPEEATKLTSDKNGLKLDRPTASTYAKSPDAFDKKANKDEPMAGAGGVNLNNVAWATQPDQAVNLDQLTQTVSSVGFFVQQNAKDVTNPTTTKAEKVTADDVLNFADGTNSKVNVATVRDVATGKDTTTVQVNIESATLAKDTGDNDGKIAAPTDADAGKLTTAKNVADMINAAAWKATVAEDGGEVEGTATEEKISAGDKVIYKAGKNIKLKQEGKNFTVATKDDVTFNSVNVTAAAAPTFTAGNTNGLIDLANAPSQNSVLTVKDAQNLGWVVSSDKTTGDLATAYTDQVRNAKEVKFVGTGIATVSGKTEGDIRTITVDVKAPETATLTAEPVGEKDGKIAAPAAADENKLTTAKNVAEMINSAAWKAKAEADGGEVEGEADAKIAAGDKVTYKAGKNIKLKQDGKNFTFSTVESPSFTSTTIGDPAKPEEATKLTSDKNGLKLDRPTANPYAKSLDAFDKKASKDEPMAGAGGVNLNNVAWATQPDQAVNLDQLSQTVNSSGFFVKNNAVDVVNAGNSKPEKVTANDIVDFVDGTNSKVEVATKRDAATGVDTTTVKVNVVLPTTELAAEAANSANEGKIAAPAVADENKLTTAKNVANMINSAAWKATAEAVEGGEVEVTSSPAKVSAGDTVTYKAGKNIKLVQDGKNFTVATKDNVNFNSVNVTTAAAPTFADGNTKGLIDLDKAPSKDSVLTVKDAQNLGWVVSADGNNYTDQVRNANEVKFVGKDGISVEGKTTDQGVREITVALAKGEVISSAKDLTTKDDNTPVVKVGDKYYKAADVVNGVPNENAAEVAGDNVQPANKGAGFVTGNQVGNAIQESGWNVGLGDKAKADAAFADDSKALSDTKLEKVNPEDNLRFVDGVYTKVKLATKETITPDGKTVTDTFVKVNVDAQALPVAYADTEGNKLVKVGDKFYNIDPATGEPNLAKEVSPTSVSSVIADPTSKDKAVKNAYVPTDSLAKQALENAKPEDKEVFIYKMLNLTNDEPYYDPALLKAQVDELKNDPAKLENYLKEHPEAVTALASLMPEIKQADNGVALNNVAWATKPDQAVNLNQLKNSAWKVNSRAVDGSNGKVETVAETSEQAGEQVKADQTVNIDAGNNIIIKRSGRNIAISTSSNPEYSSISVGQGNNATPISANEEGIVINQGKAPKKIQNVAAGTKPNDAVNVAQLRGLANQVKQNRKRSDAGTASVAAMANIPQVYLPGKSGVGVGVGYRAGQTAVAVGYSRTSDNAKHIIKVSAGVDTQHKSTLGAGYMYQW